ncbi:hypothetical protein [Streptomyces sp. NEAU-174]|uniref:hypothetical protein n=1 Tax=Streptomyces sp. NEAU-174 TaxID=3458254 RepID=UPI004044E4C0
MTTVTTPATIPPALAHRVAAQLPHRDGNGWTTAPYAAWWTTRPAYRLAQTGRPGALIIAEHPWRTEIAWQLDDREPYGPDLSLDRMAPEPVAREILRLILPCLDDASALAYAHRPAEAERTRLRHLELIGSAMRAHGAAPRNLVGDQPNSHLVAWRSQGVRYVVTLVGAQPACDLSVTGPLTVMERVLPLFLPEPAAEPSTLPSTFPVPAVSTHLGRHVAAYLAQFTPVDQLDDGGLTFGAATGPFGYLAPSDAPGDRLRDTAPISAELHGVGVDHLVHLASILAR